MFNMEVLLGVLIGYFIGLGMCYLFDIIAARKNDESENRRYLIYNALDELDSQQKMQILMKIYGRDWYKHVKE